ncbi:MAG: polysaccharide deacetylase family protein [Pseudomonadota bacterium]|nr:polysaccharide deacetylase family protein [Pseudomonadota bacterium]
MIRFGALVLAAGISLAVPVVAADAAVIVMYHRFGESVHPSTNIGLKQFEAHLEELARPQYTVLPLPEIIEKLKARKPLPDRTVGISIDDAFLSVYREAFPRLQKAGLPFTLFVATRPVDRSIGGYMSWDQIRELHTAGVTIGSQTHTHLHMAQSSDKKNRGDLEQSNARFKAELGRVPSFIAYPYGEYSLAVGRLSKEVGLTTGFGQHSGVVHADSDMLYLPRFAMNEKYGGIDRFKLVVNALPLRVTDVSPADPQLSPDNNPPILGFTVKGPATKNLSKLACYVPGRGEARMERLGSRVEVRLQKAFPPGRIRMNCTIPARPGRWRWYGLLFYLPHS